ncbi:serine/arginine repetitive matrix protein 1-like [Venturia canescens]|uniref:serine/arginine repetitive matrix protein 1-like n=1 Tax=Venturia canescens TaxID=32260 RepID=UPI001C9BDA8A|nr:serine/arginine repetitive matrix protein 1-like [Venturia canescens]
MNGGSADPRLRRRASEGASTPPAPDTGREHLTTRPSEEPPLLVVNLDSDEEDELLRSPSDSNASSPPRKRWSPPGSPSRSPSPSPPRHRRREPRTPPRSPDPSPPRGRESRSTRRSPTPPRQRSPRPRSLSPLVILGELQEALKFDWSEEIDTNPLFNGIRPFASLLAASEYVRPGFVSALTDLVRALTHQGCGYCPIAEGLRPPRSMGSSATIREFPLTRESGTQTVEPEPLPLPAVPPPPQETAIREPEPANPSPPSNQAEASQATENRVTSELHPKRKPSRELPNKPAQRTRYGACYNCGSSRHARQECPEPPGIFCFRCGTRGVTVRTCPIHGPIYEKEQRNNTRPTPSRRRDDDRQGPQPHRNHARG